jgi:hypothetical protein
MARLVSEREADLNATIDQLHGQLQVAITKIDIITAGQSALANAAATTSQTNARAAVAAKSQAHAAADETATQSARLRMLQSTVNDQQMRLQATQSEIARTRSDLEGNLNSTRNELNGSIARTHEELVALEKRGERNYFEFDAAKSKQFVRAGPLSLTLSKTDTKHSSVDLTLLVNDRQMNKKGVNLYEPVWINETQDAPPMQVVINKIEKDWVHGYVSASKYSRGELNASSASAAPSASTRSGTSAATQTSAAGPTQ